MQNWADTSLLVLLDGMASVLKKQQPQFPKVLELACTLCDAHKQVMGSKLAYKEMMKLPQPKTKVVGNGVINYKEVPCTGHCLG
ncbi:hypothetical protein LPJ59_002006, partial [Coemansia sp. RSA 2399]